MNQQHRPLSGIRVLDASRVLAGPFCGALLADLGAEVIRLEHPTQKDEVRTWEPIIDGVSATYLAVNHSKRGIALDMGTPDGLILMKRLLERSDVLLENFRVGTMERLGLGADVIKTLYPHLIHCAVRAFPNGVADGDLPGYEASIQAFTGIMHATGENGGEPVRCGPSVIDLSTGLSAVISILVALRERDRLGTGQYVEPALLRTATQLLGPQVTGYFMAEVLPVRYGSGHERLVPYQNFQCSDGFLLIAGGNDRLWEKLCKVLSIPEGPDGLPFPTLALRTRNREVVVKMVADRVAQRTRSELRQALGAAGVPCAPVNDISEYLKHPGLREAGVLQSLSDDGQFTLPGMLFGSETVPAPQRTPPPATGEHTVEILGELGIDMPEIERLRAQGTIR